MQHRGHGYLEGRADRGADPCRCTAVPGPASRPAPRDADSVHLKVMHTSCARHRPGGRTPAPDGPAACPQSRRGGGPREPAEFVVALVPPDAVQGKRGGLPVVLGDLSTDRHGQGPMLPRARVWSLRSGIEWAILRRRNAARVEGVEVGLVRDEVIGALTRPPRAPGGHSEGVQQREQLGVVPGLMGAAGPLLLREAWCR